MLVVFANNLPPAIRGRMKLWFIEPSPTVFVSGVNNNVADKVIEYLYKKSPSDIGLMIFRTCPEPPFYKIFSKGYTRKSLNEISGMQLVIEKCNDFTSDSNL